MPMWVRNIPQCGKASTKRVYTVENYKVVMTKKCLNFYTFMPLHSRPTDMHV